MTSWYDCVLSKTVVRRQSTCAGVPLECAFKLTCESASKFDHILALFDPFHQRRIELHRDNGNDELQKCSYYVILSALGM